MTKENDGWKVKEMLSDGYVYEVNGLEVKVRWGFAVKNEIGRHNRYDKRCLVMLDGKDYAGFNPEQPSSDGRLEEDDATVYEILDKIYNETKIEKEDDEEADQEFDEEEIDEETDKELDEEIDEE